MMPAFLLLCAYKNDILDMFGEAGEKPARARRRNTHIFSPLPAATAGTGHWQTLRRRMKSVQPEYPNDKTAQFRECRRQ